MHELPIRISAASLSKCVSITSVYMFAVFGLSECKNLCESKMFHLLHYYPMLTCTIYHDTCSPSHPTFLSRPNHGLID